MKKDSSVTAFYLEALLLIVLFVAMILLLTQVFGFAQTKSEQAKELTDAVFLAGNAAEAVSASSSAEELLQILNTADNAALLSDAAGVTAKYGRNAEPDGQGCYRVDVSWLPEKTKTGTMVNSVIQVRCGEAEAPIYQLETKVFLREVSA